jgi:hypothetical protein
MSDRSVALVVGLIRDIDYYKLALLAILAALMAVLALAVWIIRSFIKIIQGNTAAMTGLRESLDDLQTITTGVREAISGTQQVLVALLARLNIDLHDLGVGEEALRHNGKNKEE